MQNVRGGPIPNNITSLVYDDVTGALYIGSLGGLNVMCVGQACPPVCLPLPLCGVRFRTPPPPSRAVPCPLGGWGGGAVYHGVQLWRGVAAGACLGLQHPC